MQIVIYLWLIVCFTGIKGALPPGLTSLKKCNNYHNLNISEKDFNPLSKHELSKISEDEWNYPPIVSFAGGKNAVPKQLPFMAALGYDNDGQKEFVCGGTLVSEQFVLTAAHCIYSRSWGQVKYIRLGDLNLTSSTDDIGVQEFQVKDVYVHPDYKHPAKYNDIALIKLDSPAKFTEYVSPACLEPKRTIMKYQFFHAAGWGRLGHGESASDHLQVGLLKHYPDIECQKTFQPEYKLQDGVIPGLQICAGAYTSIADTCEGDSGGPLAYKYLRSDTVYMIAGITSFGKACAIDRIPAVYTRVSNYTGWIEKTVWPNESNE